MNRIDKRRRKRNKKIILSLIVIFLMLIVLPTSYFAYDYFKSYNAAVKEAPKPAKKTVFKGKPAQKDEKVKILLIGVDTRVEGEASNSDTMMVAQYDTKTKSAKIASLMRDLYVDIPGKQKKYKLNAAYMMGGGKDGAELLRQTIQQNFGIDVNEYAIIDFKGFSKAIDQAFPDGIEINVEHRMSKGIGMTLKPGLQRLHGKELLAYSRFRKDSQNDFGRVKRQQEVIEAITKEMSSFAGATKLPGMVGTIQPYIETSIEPTRVISLMTSYMMGDHQLEKLTIPLADSYEGVRIDKQDVLQFDEEKNREALQQFFE
ncbi:LCP family protein [Bacillus sp. 1P06AnD]|uniref:LCP family protein n=1 Tax=Bacillus sp. 1P06AnD TaxID=3132208 RepID=UPI0039A12A9B